MQTTDQILDTLRASIEADVRQQVRTELLAKLTGTTPVAKPASGRRSHPRGVADKAPRASKPTSATKRSPADLAKTCNQVLAYVKGHPSASAEAIRTSLGVPLSVIELPIKKLLAGKALTRKGEKRATRYYAGKGV